jgi:hypothetical protein
MEQSPSWETDFRSVKKYDTFYGTEGLLPFLQEPFTAHCPVSDESSPHPPIQFP